MADQDPATLLREMVEKGWPCGGTCGRTHWEECPAVYWPHLTIFVRRVWDLAVEHEAKLIHDALGKRPHFTGDYHSCVIDALADLGALGDAD